MVQVFNRGDDVVLEVQDLELAAGSAKHLDLFDFQLVQRYLLQVVERSLVVLGLFAQQLKRDPHFFARQDNDPGGAPTTGATNVTQSRDFSQHQDSGCPASRSSSFGASRLLHRTT